MHEQEIAAAKRSLYYWWWRYLRLSSDYWWLCEQNGKTTDKAFASVFRDFGDVFTIGFDEWWERHGARIFAYKLDPPRVSLISLENFDLIGASRSMYAIAIPKFQTKSEILSQLSDLLKDHQPMPYPRSIATDHEVGDLRGIRKQVLIDAHRAWCLNDAVNRAKSEGQLDRPERFTQYWIGGKLGIIPKSDAGKVKTLRVQANERLAVRVKVNRYLSKANLVISNVEIGHFPVFHPVTEVKRWTKKQLTEKQDAISSGAWICPESATEKIMTLLK